MKWKLVTILGILSSSHWCSGNEIKISPTAQEIRQERFFFNFPFLSSPWIPLPGIFRPGAPPSPSSSSNPVCPASTVAATQLCSCGTTFCLAGQYCTSVTSSTCSSLGVCGTAVLTSSCRCGANSVMCVRGQTCAAATSTCTPAVCDSSAVATAQCLCGTATCASGNICTPAVNLCTSPQNCLNANIALLPCLCGTARCSVGQTCTTTSNSCS